jgi:polysaccharide chain length determinant protein (PEP-CTERM system associated)
VLVSTVTAIVSLMLTDRFRSETVIMVIPQRVPESYVRSTVTVRIEDRLQTISQQILSRTKLEQIIKEFDLYAEERQIEVMEDVVAEMRQNISVNVVKGDAFRVTYIGDDPRTVMRVTDRLASLFIDENLRDRELLAEGTNQFLEAQLEESRRRLIEQEQRLADYQRRNARELPAQAQANLQGVQNAQSRMQALNDSMNRDRDRKLAVERALADLNMAVDEPVLLAPTVPGAPQVAVPGATLRDQIRIAERDLATLTESRGLTDEHPDVVRAKRLVAELKAQAEAAALQVPLSPEASSAGPSPAQAARNNRLRELQAELENLDKAIASKVAEEERLRQVAQDYQAWVEGAPLRQAEMTELTRDYGTLQGRYNALLAKMEDSRMAADLERREGGQQFKLLDPARLPERPFSPNRVRLNILGALFGLGFGAALATIVEYRDTTLRSEEDVAATLALPVLARIPEMVTASERRRLRRVRLTLSMTAIAAVLLAGSGAAAWKLGALDALLK